MQRPLRLTWIALAMCAVATVPAYGLGGRDSLLNLLVGAGLSWLAITATDALLRVVFRDVRQAAVLVAIAGFFVRLVLLFALLVLVLRARAFDVDELVLWIVGFYVVLVIVEARGRAQQLTGED